jgi:hypothetical protein
MEPTAMQFLTLENLIETLGEDTVRAMIPEAAATLEAAKGEYPG